METTQHAEDPGTADSRVTWRMGLLVTAFAVLAFLPALACGFVIPDDKQNFQSNQALDYPWGQKLAWAWTTRWMEVYQPLWWMLVMAEHAVWGLKPMGYHAVSLALHAAVTAALFALTLAVLRRVTPEAKGHAGASAAIAAGLASLLFCVHPLRTEMVVWLSAQPHLPSVLCMILGVVAYLNANQADRTPRSRLGWLVGSFLLGSAAMFFKTSAVTFPFILLVLDWYPLGRLTLDPERSWPWPSRQAWRAVVEKAPLLALSGVMMAVTRWAKPPGLYFRVRGGGRGTPFGPPGRRGAGGLVLSVQDHRAEPARRLLYKSGRESGPPDRTPLCVVRGRRAGHLRPGLDHAAAVPRVHRGLGWLT